MLPIILCLFEGLNDLRLVYNDCEKIYFITFVKVGVAIYNDHTVVYSTVLVKPNTSFSNLTAIYLNTSISSKNDYNK